MVELRKRKAPADTVPPPRAVKKINSVKSSTSSKKGDSSTNGSAATSNKLIAGDTIIIDGFGGEVETNDGEKVTLKKLMDESKSGVVLFTYPKASTPGCKHFTSLHFEFFCCFQVLRSATFRLRNETLGVLTQVISLGTTQACLFRDEFLPLTATGYSIYGLSTDSAKSNTTFKTKQNLPYVRIIGVYLSSFESNLDFIAES